MVHSVATFQTGDGKAEERMKDQSRHVSAFLRRVPGNAAWHFHFYPVGQYLAGIWLQMHSLCPLVLHERRGQGYLYFIY